MVSSREFSEWQAYDRVQPFGFERDNLMAGLVTAAVYNVHRDPRKTKVFQPSDFKLEMAGRSKGDGARERVKAIFDRLKGMFGPH